MENKGWQVLLCLQIFIVITLLLMIKDNAISCHCYLDKDLYQPAYNLMVLGLMQTFKRSTPFGKVFVEIVLLSTQKYKWVPGL